MKPCRWLVLVCLVCLLTGCALVKKTEPTEPTVRIADTPPSEVPYTEPETEPTTVPAPQPEPQEERFLITFVGDCTLGTDPKYDGVMYSFPWTMGEDYDYPFRNVKQYFEEDDLTVVNLEGTFCEKGLPRRKAPFNFRGPVEYVNILTGSSVELASFANNHTLDFYPMGYDATLEVLSDAGISYVEDSASTLYTTQNGLKVGVYAAQFTVDQEDMEAEFAALREQGAEILVLSIHWGVEGSYRPLENQVDIAHDAIDAGADIVYGHHPHVLQRVEEYNGGIIYYSVGNFCFGGNNYPKDLDTAIFTAGDHPPGWGNGPGRTDHYPCVLQQHGNQTEQFPAYSLRGGFRRLPAGDQQNRRHLGRPGPQCGLRLVVSFEKSGKNQKKWLTCG